RIRTKQTLIDILTPEIERATHELNARVRKRYFAVKAILVKSEGEARASRKDYLLEPPKRRSNERHSELGSVSDLAIQRATRTSTIPGLNYRIEHKRMETVSFFEPLLVSRDLVVSFNEDHPFYESVSAYYARSA